MTDDEYEASRKETAMIMRDTLNVLIRMLNGDELDDDPALRLNIAQTILECCKAVLRKD